MKRDVMIDGLLSALNEDTDEEKHGTVMLKPVFFITFTPVTLKMWVITSFARRYKLKHYPGSDRDNIHVTSGTFTVEMLRN